MESARLSPVNPKTGTTGQFHTINCGLLQHSVGFALLRANRIQSQAWASGRGEQAFSLVFYSAFVLIGANPGISLVELARFVAVDKSRASELIDSMENEQLVVRRRLSDDHRKQGIYLTPAGTARLAMLNRQVFEHERRMQNLYSEEERRQLIALLARI